jgi:hypothetical protein
MYLPGTSLFVKPGLRSINIRTASSITSKPIIIGKVGDPAAGKFVGKFREVVSTSDGMKWIRLDYNQPRFIDSKLVQDVTADIAVNQSVYSPPGKRVQIYEGIAKSRPILEMEAARLLGYVNRTVQTGNGTWIVLNPVGSTTVPWYVRAENVITESQVKEALRQAILNDQVIFKGGLLAQDHLNRLRKKGINVDRAELRLASIMGKYQDRQKTWEDYRKKGIITGSNLSDSNTLALWNKVKKDLGIAAINWVAVGIAALVVATVGGAIAVSVYKSFWEKRPDKASAIDANLLANYNREMGLAKTDPERERITQKYLGMIQEEKQKGWEEGKNAGKDEGFFSNLGSQFGTILGLGIGGTIIYKTFVE